MISTKWNCAAIRIALFTVALSLVSSGASAQSTVTINGTVKDQSGAVIPNVSVTATNTKTGIRTVSPTDDGGRYTILGLPAGFYDVEAGAGGFSTAIQRNREFFVGTTITIDFSLQVSSVSQTVEVTADAGGLEVTQSTVTNILQTSQLDNLPLITRSFSDLASLTPGVQVSPASIGSSGPNAGTVTISNSTSYETGYVLDDIPITRPSDSGLYVNLAQDWIQEFSVLTTQFPAEYAGAASGVVNAVTRSGANQIHGRGYGFFQNQSLNATPAFLQLNKPGATKAPFNQERVGGMFGGPVLKDKLFYFGGYEYLRNLVGVTLTPAPAAFAGSPFVLPQDLLGGAYGNLSKDQIAMLKIDYQISTNDSISLSGNIEIDNAPNNVPTGAASTYGSGGSYNGGNYSEGVNWKHIISPTTLNELRVYSARRADNGSCTYASTVPPFNLSTPALTQYGVTFRGNPTGYYAGLSYPGAAGDPGLMVGCPTRYGGGRFIGIYAGIYETLSKTKGNHEIKIGGSATDPYYGSYAAPNGTEGLYTFPSSGQPGPFVATNPATFPQSYSVSWGPVSASKFSATGWAVGLFAQDSWKITPSLTLNPGIRYDVDFSYGNFKKYIPAGANPIDNDYTLVAPRMGFAWTPFKDKSTVIRGGFGIFYGLTYSTERSVYGSKRSVDTVIDGFTANSQSQNPYCISPGGCGTSGAGLTKFNAYQANLKELLAWSLVNNTIPDLTKTSVTVGGVTYALPGFSGTIPQGGVFNIDQDKKTPGTMQTSVGVQHNFTNGLTVGADFAYVRGFNQTMLRNININQALLPAVVFVNPAYTTYYSYGNGGWFTSKELLAKVSYRDHRGDTAQLAYTLGYSYGNSSSSQDFTIHSTGGVSTNPFDFSADNGPEHSDQRNNIVASGVLKTVLGINIDPIFNFGSALPYTATTNATGIAGCQAWYNQCYPVGYSKDSLRGANTVTLNARIQRVIHLGESRSLTPMFEVFNVFNHTNLGTNFVANVSAVSIGGFKGFMQPSGNALPKRQLQLGVRFDF